MKKYKVIVSFEGAKRYCVEAENAKDAEEKALDLFDDDDDASVRDGICNTEAEVDAVLV